MTKTQSTKRLFRIVKAPIHQGKNLMPSSHELDRLKARVQALRQQAEAPFISIDVWHEGEVPPDPKPWQLRIMIERRD